MATSPVALTSDVAGAVRPARFSAAQFDRMSRAGVFDPADEKRFELVRGGIIAMVPPNPPHDHVVSRMNTWAMEKRVQDPNIFEVRIQCGMDFIDQDSVTLPDVALVEPRSYWAERPTATQTLLLVEVAEATLRHDLNEKMALYAEAHVTEYWVVDVPHRSVVVHRQPSHGRYRQITTHGENESIAPEKLPQLALSIGELFGPA